jgi:hypothetical protein
LGGADGQLLAGAEVAGDTEDDDVRASLVLHALEDAHDRGVLVGGVRIGIVSERSRPGFFLQVTDAMGCAEQYARTQQHATAALCTAGLSGVGMSGTQPRSVGRWCLDAPMAVEGQRRGGYQKDDMAGYLAQIGTDRAVALVHSA